jgi:hypothetical protein
MKTVTFVPHKLILLHQLFRIKLNMKTKGSNQYQNFNIFNTECAITIRNTISSLLILQLRRQRISNPSHTTIYGLFIHYQITIALCTICIIITLSGITPPIFLLIEKLFMSLFYCVFSITHANCN